MIQHVWKWHVISIFRKRHIWIDFSSITVGEIENSLHIQFVPWFHCTFPKTTCIQMLTIFFKLTISMLCWKWRWYCVTAIFWIKNDIAGQLKLRTIMYFYYLTDTLLIYIICFQINYIFQHYFQCLSLKVWGCDKRKTVFWHLKDAEKWGKYQNRTMFNFFSGCFMLKLTYKVK